MHVFCGTTADMHSNLHSFQQTWADRYLTWDESQYGDTQKMVLLAEEIWLPDTAIINR